MKTHELASALTQLAKILRAGPDIDLGDIKILDKTVDDARLDNLTVAVGLDTLVGISQIDKQQWIALTEEYNIPINITLRDSSRNILGKLLRYLSDNPQAHEQFKDNINKKTNKASPELMRAFSSLLKEDPSN